LRICEAAKLLLLRSQSTLAISAKAEDLTNEDTWHSVALTQMKGEAEKTNEKNK
jgi:hypothetical protein